VKKRSKPPRPSPDSGSDPERSRRPRPARRPGGRWKRAIQNAGLAVGVIVLLLAVLEVFLRVAFDGKYGKRPSFFVPAPVLGWECTASLDDTFYGSDMSIRVRTDEYGYRLGRLGDVDFHKRLILLAGDSNVFGWGVSTEETAASYLDELISNASGGEARVVNLGVGGYGTLQYFVRIRNVIEKHPDAKIAAVVVVHAPNDAVDNVNTVGYYFGAWKVQRREAPSRSPLHVVNLFSFAVQVLKDWRASSSRVSEEGKKLHPYLQDNLFSFDTQLPRTLHPEITLNGRTISFRNVTEEDWMADRTFERGSFTGIQRDMMLASVGSIHALLSGRETRLLHIVIPTAPDWFASGIADVVNEIPPLPEDRSGFYGKLLDPDQYEGQVLNQHAGGHYTPDFNKAWAEKIYELLRSQGVEFSGQ
jgi:hypothetical protein